MGSDYISRSLVQFICIHSCMVVMLLAGPNKKKNGASIPFLICLVILVVVQWSTVRAAVGVSSSTVGTAGENDTTATVSSVDVSGSDRLLVVGVSIFANNGNEAVSTITYTPDGGSAESLMVEDVFEDSDDSRFGLSGS